MSLTYKLPSKKLKPVFKLDKPVIKNFDDLDVAVVVQKKVDEIKCKPLIIGVELFVTGFGDIDLKDKIEITIINFIYLVLYYGCIGRRCSYAKYTKEYDKAISFVYSILNIPELMDKLLNTGNIPSYEVFVNMLMNNNSIIKRLNNISRKGDTIYYTVPSDSNSVVLSLRYENCLYFVSDSMRLLEDDKFKESFTQHNIVTHDKLDIPQNINCVIFPQRYMNLQHIKQYAESK